MGSLDEAAHRDTLLSYTPEQWKPLFDLIPAIEEASTFRTEKEWGSEWAPIVDAFHSAVYAIPIIVSFDWMKWEEGAAWLADPDLDFDTIDLGDKCKLLTSIVRAERFTEGVLPTKFEDGTIQRILRSIENDVGR